MLLLVKPTVCTLLRPGFSFEKVKELGIQQVAPLRTANMGRIMDNK
jgi:hypothetical protein